MNIFGFQIKRTDTAYDLVARARGKAEGERRALAQLSDAGWSDVAYHAFPGGPASGARVTEETSLQIAAVYACVRVLAESVASLPLKLYRRRDRGREVARDHVLFGLLQVQGNDLMTAMKLREVIMVHLALWGNFFGEIQRDGRGRPVAIWPIHPARVTVRVVTSGARPALRFEVYRSAVAGGTPQKLSQDEVFFVPGLGTGVLGKSPIELHREGLGITLAAERYGARFFKNDARPGLVLQHPGTLGEEAYANLKKSHNEQHQGTENAHRLMILEEGMTATTVGLPPDDAQFIETRSYQRGEVASIFRVPPHKIGDLSHATFSNIEHQSIEFVVDSLRPWLVRIEQAANAQLLDPAERGEYYVEHVVEGLLRGDIASRYEAYTKGRNWGWFSANDIREMENLNPIDDGDVYLQPLNMVPAGADPMDMPGSGSAGGDGARRLPSVPDSVRAVETRALPERFRMARAFERVYRDLFERLNTREVAEIRAALERFLGNDIAGDTRGFTDWLVRFADEHAAYVAPRALPAYASMAEAMVEAARSELGSEITTDEIDQFVRDYVGAYSRRHVGATRGQLLQLVDDAEDAEAARDAVAERLDEWEYGTDAGTRAEKEAAWERQRSSNAFTLAAWAVAGVTTHTWRNTGSKTCPYCTSLDGMSVRMGGSYVDEGGSVQDLQVSSRISHPPIHQGCDCILMPGGERAAFTGAERRGFFDALLEGGEARSCEHEPSGKPWRIERDAKIREAYPALMRRHGSAFALTELAEEHNISERTVERALGWG